MTAALINVIATRRRRGRIIPLAALAFDNEHLFGEAAITLTGDVPDIQHLIAATFDNDQHFGEPVVERLAGELSASLAASTVIDAQLFGDITLSLIDPIVLAAAAFDNAHEFGDVSLDLPLQIATPTIFNAQEFGDITLSFLAAEIALEAEPFDNAQAFETPTVVVGMFVETSYDFLGGKGERTSFITVTASGGPSSGTYGNWVDGAFANNSADSWWWSSSGAHWFQWNFTTMNPAGVVIDEITFHQSNATTHATYQFKGSMDGANWTDIGSSFVLGGQTAGVRSFPQVNYFTHYRMERVSGSFSSSPWMQEVEFKISVTPEPPSVIVTMMAIEPILTVASGVAVTVVAVEPMARVRSDMLNSMVAIEPIIGMPPEPVETEETNPEYDGFLQQGWNPDDTASSIVIAPTSLLAGIVAGNGSDNTAKNTRGINPVLGKRYWETRILDHSTSGSNANQALGVGTLTQSLTAGLGLSEHSIGLRPNGDVWHDNTNQGSSGLGNWAAGDYIQIAFDPVTHKIWFGRNNSWQGDPAAGTGGHTLPSGTYYPMANVVNTGVRYRTVFATYWEVAAGPVGQNYAPPSGFISFSSRWDTA
jgi:hypothetical protein